MAFKFGKYDICIMDLLTDGKTGKLSTVKIWQHIGFTFMSYIMGKTIPTIVSWEYVGLFISYGAIVAGSYVAINLFKWRWRDSKPD